MRMGFTMRQQVVAAIHAKVLRLNSAAVAHANSGRIINIASNDVRRFDEGFSFWLFCWAGPLEAGLVLMMVSLELGFVPAVAGMAAMLAVIPLQVGLWHVASARWRYCYMADGWFQTHPDAT